VKGGVIFRVIRGEARPKPALEAFALLAPRRRRGLHLPRLVDVADPEVVAELGCAFRPVIPVDRALLCLDCESIFEAEGTQHCPSCGSRTAWALNRALNRRAQGEKA
jgi:hypothetical protein